MLIIEPKECYRERLRCDKKRFVGAVCLTYLSLDAVAVNGIVEETLRYGDEHLCTVGFSIYHSQRICLQALAFSWLKETLDEQMAAQMFALRKTVLLHFSISFSLSSGVTPLSLAGNDAAHSSWKDTSL